MALHEARDHRKEPHATRVPLPTVIWSTNPGFGELEMMRTLLHLGAADSPKSLCVVSYSAPLPGIPGDR
ncbi:hypothetical protein VNO77_41992 [Canavalia gladiata]|uniref:Uncharacterized protein n=1 Tax=Canavalia gladiata TaxID=3824 RepID=A0AAN9PSZ2_CANGL